MTASQGSGRGWSDEAYLSQTRFLIAKTGGGEKRLRVLVEASLERALDRKTSAEPISFVHLPPTCPRIHKNILQGNAIRIHQAKVPQNTQRPNIPNPKPNPRKKKNRNNIKGKIKSKSQTFPRSHAMLPNIYIRGEMSMSL
jgi:hypothetical protein